MLLGVAAVLGIGASAASAIDTCPNVVFRTGPSAKLPDCRAYELVTPAYTGGLGPTYEGHAASITGMFATDTVTSAGDSVVFNSVGGGLPGFPATGDVDRYRAKRTPTGWVTEPTSPSAEEVSGLEIGGISPDHEYSVLSAFGPSAKLLGPAFVGKPVVRLLRTPSGYEPLARGSLGDAEAAEVGSPDWVTAGATHVIFTSTAKLEPNAPEPGVKALYDRTPGGPTHVVSLLPGNVTPSNSSELLGLTRDGTEVAFQVGSGPTYIRRNNTVTEEVVRPGGVVVGKVLECTGGPESAALAYQWLRNGTEIGSANSSTYTTTAADEGTVVQCRVTASNGEGTSLITSDTTLVEPYQGGNAPDTSRDANVNAGIAVSPVGTPLTCVSPSFGSGSPTLAYQWLKDGTEIGGASSSTYAPVDADVGSSLQCRVTASNAEGTAVVYSYNPVSIYKAAPKASATPAISNETDAGNPPQVGDELACSNGTWSASPAFAYQWLANGEEIGASSSTYTVAVADEGKTIQCRVTGTNAGGSTQAVSDRVIVDPQPGTTPPEQTFPGGVFGTAQVGHELFCGAGGWEGEPSFDYQWLRNGAEIAGETSSTYTLTAEDLGTVVQCRIIATNAGGATVSINANEGAMVITRAVPAASASLSQPGLTFDGVFNGRVFYSDVSSGAHFYSEFGDLYMYDLDEEKTTRITDTDDASIVNVSEDGSHVYFVSYSQINGEGEAGKPNLGVWTAVEGAKFIVTVGEEDVKTSGRNQTASLNTWALAISPADVGPDRGRASNHTRSTPDGTVFAFESTAQLTGFDNTEVHAADCGKGDNETNQPVPGQPCDEVYRYDATSEELTCVSCGSATGPATGNARLQTVSIDGGFNEMELATPNAPVRSLTDDGNTVFFESTEGLVPQDGNNTKDVYRWTKGSGVALISTGQGLGESALYGVTQNGSDAIFGSRQQLLPQDENGTAIRLYDARVDGGFPPPEETVTEPCVGDVCHGQAASAPEAPNVASSSLNGNGNVPAKLRCGKHSRRVVRKGTERCLRHHKHHRRAHHKRRAAR